MTLRIALIDDQTGECEIGGQRCKVVPVEPVASLWLQHGEIVNAFPHPPSDPRQWDYDGHFRSKGYSKEPLYRAAALDLSSLPVVPERDKRVLGDNEREEGHTDGWNQALDAIGVRG